MSWSARDLRRFWQYVEPAKDCWGWTGACTKEGRGRIMLSGKRVFAARVALELTEGPAPVGSPFALHSCDNANCVNPAHLRWGTQQENVEDRRVRGRSWRPAGTTNPSSKLTEEQIAQIVSDPRSSRPLAQEYNVTQACICQVRRKHANKLGATQGGKANLSELQPRPQEEERPMSFCKSH